MSDQTPSVQTTNPTSASSNDDPGMLGYIFIIVFFVILIWLVYRGYVNYIAEYPVVVSMSAYFGDKDNNVVTSPDAKDRALIIKGDVHKNGQPVKAGTVQLSVSTEDGQFAQTVSTPLKDGHFEIKDPAFSSLKPDDALQIAGQVSSSEFSEVRTHEIFLNTTQPTLGRNTKLILWVVLMLLPLGLLVVFFAAFTGTKTPKKNRVAIILSYCIIGLFLAIPLLAPVFLLHAFPDAKQNMIGAPVGLVVTRIGKPVPGQTEDDQTQWAVNIGGFSTRISDSQSPSASPSPTPANTSAPVVTSTPAGGQENAGRRAPTPASSAGAPAGQASASPASGPGASQPGTTAPTSSFAGGPSPAAQTESATPVAAQPVASPTTGPITSSGSPSASPVASGQSASPQRPASSVTAPAAPTPKKAVSANDYMVKVTGGLVIPLYVIILSVIGGAINMTRKVPRFQREGEYSEFAKPDLSWKKWMASARQFMPGGNAGKSSETASETVATGVAGNPEATGKPADDSQAQAEEEPNKKKNKETENGPTSPAGGGEDSPSEKKEEAKANPTTMASAKVIDGRLDDLVREQTERSIKTQETMSQVSALVNDMGKLFESKKEDESILGYASFEDWYSSRTRLKELFNTNWRVELLYQYMYLIAAPFLAIVAYYILDLMGLTKQGILVLISFSVGLISERILSWLLGIASGYMRDPSAQTPARTS